MGPSEERDETCRDARCDGATAVPSSAGGQAMNQRQDNLITVLQDGVLRYRGHGIEPSKGMRKGLIAELGPAAEAINRAALTAERTAKAGIETAVVGIGGAHVGGGQ